jgi:hypothetical protein
MRILYFAKQKSNDDETKKPAYNLRFGATAAVTRMNLSCEIE